MRIAVMILAMLLGATSVAAQSVTVTRPVRAGELLSADLLAFGEVEIADGFSDPRDLIGLEARVNLFPGRPMRERDVGMPTVVERNAIVPLIFNRGGLTILSEGRALQRAGSGESVRVMNLSSRSTVVGIATETGSVVVN